MRKFHPLTYRIAPRDKKRLPKMHQRRDLCAGLELASALYRLGFQLGYQILNQPPRKGPQKPLPGGRPFPVDISFVKPQDILLHFTRPPFSDIEAGAKRKIAPAYTDLEERLFKVWQRFLWVSSRDHVHVARELHGRFDPRFRHCRQMSFRQKGWGAPYSRVNACEGEGWRLPPDKRRTVLFLLRLAEAWEGGPGYVCAFGMDGCTTLIWAHRLATDLSYLLEKPGFVIAELTLGKLPDHITDLRFSESWPIVPVLVHELPSKTAAA
jgi:hypothetical protein